MLSIIIITKNEEKMIADALKSAEFAGEIIVVDTGNTDATNQIAKTLGARVVTSSGSDYSQFRESGQKEAKGDWVLYLDADERISKTLKEEIQSTISNPGNFTVFEIPRQNIYLGKPMKYGGWGNDSVIRLFKKSSLIGWQGSLHEQPKFSGPLKKLSQPIIHYSHRDLSTMVSKTLSFTAYEAQLRYAAGHPPVSWWRIFRVMFTEFWYRFIRLSAWRDGSEGIIDGMFQVFNTFIIYARLWELQHESRSL